MSLSNTLGSDEWCEKNEEKVKSLFPETWTHLKNINMLALSYQMKLIGIDWRGEEEFGRCMVFFERAGWMLRDGMLIRRGK